MIEVGGKQLKTGLLVTSIAILGVLAFSARTSGVVKIKGEACEKFVPNHPKSSIRVRVTDKASYNAVSQIEELSELRSKMLEHDYNVIVYNLVDNYVRDLMVRTTNQSNDELCVKVTGAIPEVEIASVIKNYSPNNPAPEYDIRDAAGIEEEVLTDKDDDFADAFKKRSQEPDSEVLYNGREELAEEKDTETVVGEMPEEKREVAAVVYDGTPEVDEAADNDVIDNEATESAAVEVEVAQPQPVAEPVEETSAQVVEEDASVYISPVEFNNKTHSAKPAQVLKDMFADTEGYRLVDNPSLAYYAMSSKVLKAKIDTLNSQTKRLQMVVSVELKIQNSDVSFNEHQNRFVLFENGESEQDIAQKLLHKLLRKAGKTLFGKIEQAEIKRKNQGFITPAK